MKYEDKRKIHKGIYWISKANLKTRVFSLFLKSMMSETVRKSAGREFRAAGPENKARSPNWYAAVVWHNCSSYLSENANQERVAVTVVGCMMSRR